MKAVNDSNNHLNGKVINIGTPHEINYWCEVLECEEEELVGAIQRIGNSAKVVDAFLVLNRRKKTTNGK